MKPFSLLLFSILICISGFSQQMFVLTFNGAGTCNPSQGSQLTAQPPNIFVSAITRVNLTCSQTNDVFNSAGWSTAATINTTQYIEFSVTAAIGYSIHFANVSFMNLRSNSGPSNAVIKHDGGTGTFTNANTFTPPTSNSQSVAWSLTGLTTPGGGVPVIFRIYGWGASAGGTMRIDDLIMEGSVTSNLSSPWTVDGSNIINNSSSTKVYIGALDGNTSSQLQEYALGVNGTAIFSKAKVKLYGNWPDYVFDKGYNLLPLPELEAYIICHKHLPEIPDAGTVSLNDIDLGKSQADLLKKVEELTLYIIQLNKKIEVLERKYN